MKRGTRRNMICPDIICTPTKKKYYKKKEDKTPLEEYIEKKIDFLSGFDCNVTENDFSNCRSKMQVDNKVHAFIMSA